MLGLVDRWRTIIEPFRIHSVEPIRLTTVDPGLVESGFSKVRVRGDEERAKQVYEGVDPLTPEDIAECVLFAVTRPLHVNVDELVVKALTQASPTRIVRD